jgi:hypothetical protein
MAAALATANGVATVRANEEEGIASLQEIHSKIS